MEVYSTSSEMTTELLLDHLTKQLLIPTIMGMVLLFAQKAGH
ncbi:hypothetical protein V7177_26340 [Neobacillus niacini]